MQDAEQTPESTGHDSGVAERIGPTPQTLLDQVGIFTKTYRLPAEDEKLLLSAGIEALSQGVNFMEALGAALAANPEILRRAVRFALCEVIVVREPHHYDVMFLAAAQPHLRFVLPDECCAYLAFAGPKSSGKSTATKVVTKLAGGRFFAGGSPAALRDTFGEGQLVGLDEVDTQIKRLDDLEGILRTGNSWNAIYPLKVRQGNDWKTEERNIGGPKVFNFRGRVDDALLSRGYIVNLPRQRGGPLVVSSLYPYRLIGPLSVLLGRVCARSARKWSRALVEEHMKGRAFIDRLDRLPTGLARSQQTAAILLIISDILGLGLDVEVSRASGEQADTDEESDELAEWLREFYGTFRCEGSTRDLEVSQAALLAFINDKRRLDGRLAWPPTSGAFKREMLELGFEERKSLRRRNKSRVVLFDTDVRKCLGIENESVLSWAPEPGATPERKSTVLRPVAYDSTSRTPVYSDPPRSGAEARRLARGGFDEAAREEMCR